MTTPSPVRASTSTWPLFATQVPVLNNAANLGQTASKEYIKAGYSSNAAGTVAGPIRGFRNNYYVFPSQYVKEPQHYESAPFASVEISQDNRAFWALSTTNLGATMSADLTDIGSGGGAALSAGN